VVFILLQYCISEVLVAHDPFLSRIDILKPMRGSSCREKAFSHEILTNSISLEVMMLPWGLGGKPALIKISGEKEEKPT
jgi:hypothetical protein